MLSLSYLAVIAWEACSIKGKLGNSQKVLAVLFWQAPAAFLSLAVVLNTSINFLSDNAIFLLEFWATPVIPLLSSLPVFVDMGKPLYYYLLLVMPVLLGIYFYLIAAFPIKVSKTNHTK
ncbi:MAG: hypothetical protein ABFD08_11145 [Syntrophomonas sp.]